LTPLTIHKQHHHTKHRDSEDKGVFVQVLQSNVPRNKLHIQKAIRVTLNNAMHHCYLTTPYFVPPQSLKRAMINAAKRGVDIRILTAGVSDVILVKLASQHVYSLLLRNGVRIYELFGSTLHAKTATIDGIYSSVGSFNLDTLSHYYNLEINLTILDHRMATQLEEQFSRDIQYCTEVTLEDLEARSALKRFIQWAAYHMLRVLSIKPLYNRVMFRNRNLPLSATPSDENVANK
jgi:cardiolipin synthase